MVPTPAGGLSASRLANLAAPAIVEAFDAYQEAFAEISRRARSRFERRDWQGATADAAERLDLYGSIIDQVEGQVRETLDGGVTDRTVWAGLKAVYSGLIAGRQDWELAETFFNSVTRRIFATLGVEANIEFVDSDFEEADRVSRELSCRSYPAEGDPQQLLAAILADGWFESGYEDLERDAGLAAARLTELLEGLGVTAGHHGAELLGAPFFRRKGAYLIGRLFCGERVVPFGLALLHAEAGIVVDAVLTGDDDISIVFSFTRSHFHVDLGSPHQLVRYLKALMPKKPIAELYIALGYHKHGKTELYRDLLRHLRESGELFELALGTPGMVMVVFTMPGYDVVFKLIRDRFPAVKATTPQTVKQNYRLVFRHDRAGRLVEAQEFEHLQFEPARFSEELVAEFRRDADHTVEIGSEELVIHHAYIERRVAPLDIYLREASEGAVAAAVVDFGQAIKDLAANGIFPGELLPKNFGVTRHGRVVCYDYDELSLLTDFSFRALPASRDDEDEYADEAWFGVAPNDVFPEEFRRFLMLSPAHAEMLERAHPELYDVEFWQQTQARVRSGELIDIFPYDQSRRL